MDIKEYKNMYNKIETSQDTDRRILNSVKQGKNIKKRTYIKVAGMVAAFAMIVGIYQIPSVNAAVNNFISGFTSKFMVNNETVEMTGEYKKISPKASKQDKKFDTLADAEKELGIKLLKSKDAYEGEKNLIWYNPHMNGEGELYGAILQDDFYCVGDLKNVDVETFEDASEGNAIMFESGEKYKTPIAAEITVRSDKGSEGGAGEVNYKGTQEKFDGKSQMYELKNIDTKAIITTIENSGMPAEWEDQVGDAGDMTEALVVFDGVEYHYYGAVSQETMKEFLDGLNY